MAHTNSSSQPEDPYLKRVLTSNGSHHGWTAFEELCSEGCDPDVLSWCFFWLYDEPVRVKDSPPHDVLASRFEMQPNRLDSDDARGDFSLAELDKIAALAKGLQEQLLKIRQIPFVRELIARRALPPGDLLYLPSLYLRNPLNPQLNGLISLGDLARKVGTQKRPNYTKRLKEIYDHIHERTGQWHDRLVADILNDLKPDHAQSEDGLKTWRHRNGCA